MTNQSDINGFIGSVTNNLKTNEWAWARRELIKYLDQKRFTVADKSSAMELFNQKKSRIVFTRFGRIQ